ncbi:MULTISPECIES: helix-turn-helix domain-containing protein [unclassified Streptomyces]|uniref:helix-turn-helix domain-containing protein n=1 Tax=unclassified Streptomyces TaxID=2593676 RepID=UPI003402958B
MIRELRQGQGLSAQNLADQISEAGYPIQRGALANIESGRRKEIPIDFLVATVQALKVDLTGFLVMCGLVICPSCKGRPPEGFTCNSCGGAA